MDLRTFAVGLLITLAVVAPATAQTTPAPAAITRTTRLLLTNFYNRIIELSVCDESQARAASIVLVARCDAAQADSLR